MTVKIYVDFCVSFALIAALIPGRAAGQLKLVQRIALPGDISGPFDHFGVDLKHGRLFVTPEAAKYVEVSTNRFFVAAPKHGDTKAEILVFEVQ